MSNTPKGAPGGAPTTTAVVKFLSAAGFQISRFVENPDRIPSGARVQQHSEGVVRVTWREAFADYLERMAALGAQDVRDVPRHPEEETYLREYAEALAPRYRARVEHGAVYVYAREELPARPPKVPTAVTVRRALAAAGGKRGATAPYKVVDQPDHTRVSVFDDDHLDAVREALTAQGWTFTEAETWHHFVIKITGSMPDRPARLRKLRAERAAQAEQTAEERAADSTADQDERAPLGSYVAWAEGPQERTEFGHVVGQRGDEALVMGLDGGLRQMPADIPEPEPEPPSAPVPYEYSSEGRRWQQGQRAEFKTVDGFLYAGEIASFGEHGGERVAVIRVDTRRIGPAARPMYKGDPCLPGKPRRVDPPEEWTFPLDKLNKPV